ncbi:unnamed protein product [Rotaria sp. Silwood2]|nr:unnamed protein product [Rotaria sp. Silwood2]
MNIYRSSHLFLFILITLNSIHCDEHDHRYEDGNEVVLWMNTVGPYHNRQETYNYFSLPFCRGIKKEISHYHETLGENILGVELEYSGIEINFRNDKPKTDFCEITVTPEFYDTFTYAIKNHYWYQMFIDDLPIWGIVGEMDEAGKSAYIWTHKKFEIGYNDDRIIDVNLTSEAKVRLQPNVQLQFSYEVTWKPTKVPFSKRFDKYLDAGFFQHKIHWFSIFNSFMMVLFLVGLVSMILLRTLRKDYARYGKDDDLDDMFDHIFNNIAPDDDETDDNNLDYGIKWNQFRSNLTWSSMNATVKSLAHPAYGEKVSFSDSAPGEFDLLLDVKAELAKFDPLNIYFDNVGGDQLEAAIAAAADHARFVECGMISQFHKSNDVGIRNLILVVRKRLKLQGFIIFDQTKDENFNREFYSKVPKWIANGELKVKEDVTKGLEQAPEAIVGIFKGKNFGKAVVRIADD